MSTSLPILTLPGFASPTGPVAPGSATKTYEFTPGEKRLIDFGGWYRSSNPEKLAFLRRLYDPMETVYVAIGNKEQARYGSIGIAIPAGYPLKRSEWPEAPVINNDNAYRYFGNVQLIFENKKLPTSANVHNQELFYLQDYSGPTVWKFTKKPGVPDVEVLDKLGNKVKVGDFITYIERGYYVSSIQIKFGFIEKISPRGVVTAKNIKLNDADRSYETRITDPQEKICKLNKEIIDELMLRRLTY